MIGGVILDKELMKKIIIGFLMTAGIGILVFVFVREHLYGNKTDVRMQQVSQYELEINEIEDELERKKDEILQVGNTALISFAYEVVDEDEIPILEKITKKHEHVPSILLDCQMDEEKMDKIVCAMQGKNWGLVFKGQKIDEQILNALKQAKSIAEKYNIRVSNVFHLDKQGYSDEDVELLKKAGISGISPMTDYRDSIKSGYYIESKTFFLETVPVDGFSKKISGSIKLACSSNKEMIFTISMKDYVKEKNGKEGPTSLDQIFANMAGYQEKGRLKILSEYELVDTFTQRIDTSIKKEQEYKIECVEQKKKIEQLKQKIKDIY